MGGEIVLKRLLKKILKFVAPYLVVGVLFWVSASIASGIPLLPPWISFSDTLYYGGNNLLLGFFASLTGHRVFLPSLRFAIRRLKKKRRGEKRTETDTGKVVEPDQEILGGEEEDQFNSFTDEEGSENKDIIAEGIAEEIRESTKRSTGGSKKGNFLRTVIAILGIGSIGAAGYLFLPHTQSILLPIGISIGAPIVFFLVGPWMLHLLRMKYIYVGAPRPFKDAPVPPSKVSPTRVQTVLDYTIHPEESKLVQSLKAVIAEDAVPVIFFEDQVKVAENPPLSFWDWYESLTWWAIKYVPANTAIILYKRSGKVMGAASNVERVETEGNYVLCSEMIKKRVKVNRAGSVWVCYCPYTEYVTLNRDVIDLGQTDIRLKTFANLYFGNYRLPAWHISVVIKPIAGPDKIIRTVIIQRSVTADQALFDLESMFQRLINEGRISEPKELTMGRLDESTLKIDLKRCSEDRRKRVALMQTVFRGARKIFEDYGFDLVFLSTGRFEIKDEVALAEDGRRIALINKDKAEIDANILKIQGEAQAWVTVELAEAEAEGIYDKEMAKVDAHVQELEKLVENKNVLDLERWQTLWSTASKLTFIGTSLGELVKAVVGKPEGPEGDLSQAQIVAAVSGVIESIKERVLAEAQVARKATSASAVEDTVKIATEAETKTLNLPE